MSKGWYVYDNNYNRKISEIEGIVMRPFYKYSLIPGVLFGLYWGILMAPHYGFTFIIKSGLLFGCIAGSIFFGISYLMYMNTIKKFPYGTFDEVMSTNQNRSLEFQMPYESAFKCCMHSLQLFNKKRSVKIDENRGTITMKTHMDIGGNGQTISYSINKLNDGLIQVTISSRQSSLINPLDRGKNYKNVERIVAFLNEFVKSALSSDSKETLKSQ